MSEEIKLMKEFSEEDINDFATIWKAHQKLLKRLEDSVIYKMTVEECENTREKELIIKVAKEQNAILKGFFIQRTNKTANE